MSVKYHSQFTNSSPFSGMAPQFALAASVALTYTVPGDSSVQYRAEFSYPYDANVWVALNSTATIPTAGTMSPNSGSVLRPACKYVRGGDVLSFISNSIVANAGFELFLN